MQAWTLSAWSDGAMVGLDTVLLVLDEPEGFDWVVSRDFEATGSPEAMEVAARIYDLADTTGIVPFSLIRRLAELRGQVFDGFLAARGRGTETHVLRIVSIRGDEWDLETDDPVISQAIEQLPGVAPTPH